MYYKLIWNPVFPGSSEIIGLHHCAQMADWFYTVFSNGMSFSSTSVTFIGIDRWKSDFIC